MDILHILAMSGGLCIILFVLLQAVVKYFTMADYAATLANHLFVSKVRKARREHTGPKLVT